MNQQQKNSISLYEGLLFKYKSKNNASIRSIPMVANHGNGNRRTIVSPLHVPSNQRNAGRWESNRIKRGMRRIEFKVNEKNRIRTGRTDRKSKVKKMKQISEVYVITLSCKLFSSTCCLHSFRFFLYVVKLHFEHAIRGAAGNWYPKNVPFYTRRIERKKWNYLLESVLSYFLY